MPFKCEVWCSNGATSKTQILSFVAFKIGYGQGLMLFQPCIDVAGDRSDTDFRPRKEKHSVTQIMDDFLFSVTILFFDEETIQPLGSAFTEYLLGAQYCLSVGLCQMKNAVLDICQAPPPLLNLTNDVSSFCNTIPFYSFFRPQLKRPLLLKAFPAPARLD